MREILESNLDYIIDLRRYFHMYPEASLEEFNTAKKIESELNKLGIKNKRVGKTGIIGYIGSPEKGKTIALRADIDALEIEDKKEVAYKSRNHGLMHACGHDGHMASLLAAAKVLKSMEGDLNGQVKLFFQQGEEKGQGAIQFIEEGHLEDVDSIVGLHLYSGLKTGQVAVNSGPVAASCDYFKIDIKGKSGHVSTPNEAVDALFIGASIVVNLHSIVSRTINPLDPVLVGIGKLEAGSRHNIIAEKASLEGSFRAFSDKARIRTKKEIENIAYSTAEMYGGKASIDFNSTIGPINNDKDLSTMGLYLLCNIIGNDNIVVDNKKFLASDDFSEYLSYVPGVYLYVGSGNHEHINTIGSHHNGGFDIDERSLLVSSEIYIKYALQVLNEDQIILD